MQPPETGRLGLAFGYGRYGGPENSFLPLVVSRTCRGCAESVFQKLLPADSVDTSAAICRKTRKLLNGMSTASTANDDDPLCKTSSPAFVHTSESLEYAVVHVFLPVTLSLGNNFASNL